MTSPVQVPSVTCDLAAINVEDLASDVGNDSGNKTPSTTSLIWPTRPRGPSPSASQLSGVWITRLDTSLAAQAQKASASANIAAQALDLGLLDEVTISLVPVLMGEGIPYFANLARAPHRFDDPVIIPGSRVTHLRYAVRLIGRRPRSPST